MKFFVPTAKQWRKWSAPSKLTYVGTLAGIIGLAFTVYSYFQGDDTFQKLRTNTALYQNSKIRFEQYEANVRSIVRSKSVAVSYLESEYGDEFNVLGTLGDEKFEEIIGDFEDEFRVDLNVMQDFVIATGFIKNDERSLLAELNSSLADILSLPQFLSEQELATNKRKLVATMITALNVAEEQKNAYLNALDAMEDGDLDALYLKLTNFVTSIQLKSVSTTTDTLQLVIALKRFPTDEAKVLYIVGNENRQYESDFALSQNQARAIRSQSLQSHFTDEHYICGTPDGSPRILPLLDTGSVQEPEATVPVTPEADAPICDTNLHSAVLDQTNSIRDRIVGMQCLIGASDLSLQSKIVDTTWEGCFLENLMSYNICIENYGNEIKAFTFSLAKDSDSLDEAEYDYFVEIFTPELSNLSDPTFEQLSRFSRIMASEYAKLALLEDKYDNEISQLNDPILREQKRKEFEEYCTPI